MDTLICMLEMLLNETHFQVYLTHYFQYAFIIIIINVFVIVIVIVIIIIIIIIIITDSKMFCVS